MKFQEYLRQRDKKFLEASSTKDTDGALTMDAKDFPIEECYPELCKIHECFKNEKLADFFHELQKSQPSEKYFYTGSGDQHRSAARGLMMIPKDKKKEIKFEGRKLFMTGKMVRNWLQKKFHTNATSKDPLAPCLWSQNDNTEAELVTDAHPWEVWVILHKGIDDGILPHNCCLDWDDMKEGVIKIKVPRVSGGKRMIVKISSFRVKEGEHVRFMMSIKDDHSNRDTTSNALYFNFDDKKIYDFGGGITDLGRGEERLVNK